MYGGWVTFTGHLLWRDFNAKAPLFKIKSKVENKLRPFAFGLSYQNISKDALSVMDKQIIIAVDENNFEHLKHFREPTLFIHAMNEPNKKLLEFYKTCKRIITIRTTIQQKLADMGVKADVSDIPFYQYPITIKPKQKTEIISMARVEFRKRQDIICKANQILTKQNQKTIKIYGEANRMYVYHKLKGMEFEKWYKGRYAQDFITHQELLSDAKYLVNLTFVPKDGGNLEYTLLQALYHDTAVVLHRSWVEIEHSKWKEGYNCLAIDDEKDLANLVKSNPETTTICKNAKKLLQAHIDSKWV